MKKIKKGQTWFGNTRRVRYRVLKTYGDWVVIYIYHRLNGRVNRVKRVTNTSKIFDTLCKPQ